MEIEIVIADYKNTQHGSDIVHLLGCYAKDPMGGGEPLASSVKKNLVNDLAKIPHAFTFLCYIDNQPAGLINCFEAFSTFKCQPLLNIHDVIVPAEFRGLGINHLMLDKVATLAEDKGCCKLTLEVIEGNKIAQGSYKKYGFSDYQLDPKMGNALFWQKPLKSQ